MAVTQNTYTGNGSTTNYSFTFPYLEATDIKVSLNGTVTTAYTLANATTIQFNTAPANGAAIRIYRQTDDAALAATFYPGSAIRSADLNENFTQNLYVTQEANNVSAAATTTANTALTNSNTAISTANTALSTANTASSNASAAVATANTASSNASAAVSTANTASSNATTAVNTANAATATANSAAADAATAISTANGAVSTANAASTAATNAVNTANSASSSASSAVSTANTASSNASSAVSTANTASSNASTALSTANTALSTANAAASAVANAILYDTVANVAGIPATPANNDAVEVVDSTGIESFSPLSGRPAGFVGDSGLSVRMVYTTTGATWNWIQYFPNDPESRYGDAITTLQTDLSTAEGDILALDSAKLDATTAASTYLTQSNAASTYQTQAGMSSYLTTTAAGTTYAPLASPTFTGTATAPSVTVTGSTAPTNGVYLPGVNSFGIATNSTERLRIDSSGRLGLGSSAPVNKLDVNGGVGVAYGDGLRNYRDQNTTNNVIINHTYTGGNDQLNLAPIGDSPTSAVAIKTATGSTLSTRLFISPTGNVGVGTMSPSSRLDVAGYTKIGNYTGTFQGLSIQNNNDSSGAETISFLDALNNLGTIDSNLFFGHQTDGASYIALAATPAGSRSSDRRVERVRITGSGNVGVGTTSPATTFDLSGAYSSNAVAVAALDVNCSSGNYFTKTINGNSTFTVSNVPASRSYAFTLELTHTSGTITWFSGVVWPSSTAPTLTTGKVHLFMFFTDDGGTTWRASSLINY